MGHDLGFQRSYCTPTVQLCTGRPSRAHLPQPMGWGPRTLRLGRRAARVRCYLNLSQREPAARVRHADEVPKNCAVSLGALRSVAPSTGLGGSAFVHADIPQSHFPPMTPRSPTDMDPQRSSISNGRAPRVVLGRPRGHRASERRGDVLAAHAEALELLGGVVGHADLLLHLLWRERHHDRPKEEGDRRGQPHDDLQAERARADGRRNTRQ